MFKTFEQQARMSVIFAVVSVIAALGAAVLCIYKFRPDEGFVVFNSGGLFQPVVAAAILVSLLSGATAFFMGLSSAGQRRNKATSLSWLGFFTGAAGLTVALSTGVFFWLTRYPVSV